MKEYKRLTMKCEVGIGLTETSGNIVNDYEKVVNRLAELEDKIENGTLIELDESLIGECIVGIHHFTNGTYELDLDENIVIGFSTDGIVTWNNYHKYNDYFNYGLFFPDTEKGRAEAEKKLKELREV